MSVLSVMLYTRYRQFVMLILANPVGILLANLISPAVVGDSSHPADLLLLVGVYRSYGYLQIFTVMGLSALCPERIRQQRQADLI